MKGEVSNHNESGIDSDVDEDPKLWGNKFDALIQSPKGRNVFKNFCEEPESHEFLLYL